MTLLNTTNPSGGQKLSSEERLKSKKLVEELFNKGSSIHLYPYRIFYSSDTPRTSTGLPQILISIPKRNFKKSVDRNRLRRQIREIYRLNKMNFWKGDKTPPSSLAILYTAKEKLPYSKLEQKLIALFSRF